MVNILFPSVLTNALGAQKNPLIESTHNICLGWEIRKLIFLDTLLTKGLWYNHMLHNTFAETCNIMTTSLTS